MPQITVTEQGGTGRYISFGDAAALCNVFNNVNGGTVIAYVKPGDQAAVNYLFCKCSSSGNGLRFVANTSEQLGFSPYDSATDLNPSCTANTSFTQNAWQHWEATHPGNGSVLGSAIAMYIDGTALSLATFNGTAPIDSDAGLTAMILNRPGLGRHFIGDVAYVAMWNRVLNSTERATVRTNGPLSVPNGLVFCFANGQDYGPNAISVLDRTAQVAGSMPPNTNLGGDINLAGAASAVASASATLAGGDTSLAGNAAAQATASATLNGVAIFNTADRGTIDLANSSVTPNGTTPTISVKNRWIGDGNAVGARACFFHVTGVNGMTPVFEVDRSNMENNNATQKFLWSYTGALGSWQEFTTTTRVTSPNVYRSSNAAAFTQDTVYVSMQYPWRVGDTLPWIQSLESSGFISPAPSGSGSYQFGTRSATTNGSTAGAGDVIPAQPLHSFKISNGAALAPDGLPKRKMVLFAGMHASEDVGNYSFKGATEFLVSADTKAVSVRAWFDVYGYPGLAQAGRAAGAQRADFENSAKTEDVNRAWDDLPVLETITKHKAALATDIGSSVDVFFDFHGDIYTGTYYDYFSSSAGKKTVWENAIRAYYPGLTVSVFTASGSTVGEWIYSAKAGTFVVTPEHAYAVTLNLASVEAFGANHVKAVADLIAQGEWGQVALASDAAAVAAATGALTTGIPLATDAAAVAAGIGTLSTPSSELETAAQANAGASADLSTGIPLSADAAAQATVVASLTGGVGFVMPAAGSRIITSASRRPAALSNTRR